MVVNSEVDQYVNRVAQLYENNTILISGGSGFLGKVLVEKLLRTCNGLKKIIIILRTKKGKDPSERLQILKNDELFSVVKKEKGEDIMNKLEAVSGDMIEPNLAISKKDADMIKKEVEIIYHCAANVKFDEELKYAVLLNVGGTEGMLNLAKECKKLMVFGHFSTAYCFPHETVLYEKLYPPPADPYALLEIAKNKSTEEIEPLAKRILGDYPNTYVFAKALSEKLIADQMNNLPIFIMRPSVVVPIWKEPIPGWTDNINGPGGFLIAAGKGVLRTMYCKSDCYADFIPVDMVANFAILAPFDYLNTKTRKVYHITSSDMEQITWAQIVDFGKSTVCTRTPFNYTAWYPGGSMTRSRIYHTIRFYLFHILPAIFVDIMLFIVGIKPALLRVQRRIYKGFDLLEYYANGQWYFNNENSLAGIARMNPKEREIYKLDNEGFVMEDYFASCVLSARRYILHEPDESIPIAKMYIKVLWYVDRITKTLLVVGIVYYFLPRIYNTLTRYWYSL